MPLYENPRSSAPRRLQSGVNLIELLIVLVIAGLLLGVALPAGQGMLERGQLRAVTNEVYSALLFARNEATRLRRDVRLCFIEARDSTECDGDNTHPFLGVFLLDSDDDIDRRAGVFELDDRVSITLSPQGNQVGFQRLGNLSSGNETYFDLQISDHRRQVEACFNGRILIREEVGDTEC